MPFLFVAGIEIRSGAIECTARCGKKWYQNQTPMEANQYDGIITCSAWQLYCSVSVSGRCRLYWWYLGGAISYFSIHWHWWFCYLLPLYRPWVVSISCGSGGTAIPEPIPPYSIIPLANHRYDSCNTCSSSSEGHSSTPDTVCTKHGKKNGDRGEDWSIGASL